MIEEIKQKFEAYCNENKISEEEKKELKNKLEEVIKKSKFEPGESLGIVATQSLSEPATQMTMRAYHFAASVGIRMASGLPRLIELFDLRKDIDNVTTVYLLENSKESSEKLATEIAESKLENVISDIDYEFLNSQVKISLEKASLDKLYLTSEEVIGTIKKFVKKYSSSLTRNKICFDNVKSYSEFRILKQKLFDMHIKGVKGAKETIILNKDGEWIIQVKGGSFKKIISLDGVDSTRTVTTDIEEIKSVLGVEAARETLIREVRKTLEEQGVEVDPRYIGVAADVMCVNGEVEAMSRYGIMKHKKSVLNRLNFEETIKVLFDSAILNRKDELNTPIANLMVNQVAPTGTGTVKLRWKL
jgi:DNA-directed RNA polymerase subunit A"